MTTVLDFHPLIQKRTFAQELPRNNMQQPANAQEGGWNLEIVEKHANTL